MKRALLVSGLTLAVLFLAAQAVPNKYNVAQTLNLSTALNVETLKANVVDAGILIATGTSTLEGDVTANAALSVAGASTLTGNVTASGTLDVTGATTCGSTLDVTGAVTAPTVKADTFDGGTLYISGTSTLVGAVAASGALAVTGATILTGHLTAGDGGTNNLVVGGTCSVTGATALTGHMTAGDGGVRNLVVNGTLGVTGDSTLTGHLVAGDGGFNNITAAGTLAVTGASTFTGDLSAGYVLSGDAGIHNIVMSGELTARVLNVAGLDDGGIKGLFFPAPTADALPGSLYGPFGSNPAAPGAWQFCESEWCTASILLDGTSNNPSQILDATGVQLLVDGQPNLNVTATLVETQVDGGVALNFYVLGNSNVGGTFGVTGDTSLGYVLAGDAGVRNVAASGTLNVTGDSTLGYVLAADAGANNIVSTGTLGVTGDSTLGYVLAADAGAHNLVLTGTLGVTGDATLGYVLGADAGFNAIIATGGIKPAATGKSITFYNSTTHAALDLASVNANVCSAQETETISGAALGDSCHVAAGTELEAGTIFACSVTAANTAKWQLCNMAGAPVNRASDTYYISVLRGEP